MKRGDALGRALAVSAGLLGVPIVALGFIGGVPALVVALGAALAVGGGAALAVYLPGGWRETAVVPVVVGLGWTAVVAGGGAAAELVAGVAAVGVLLWRATTGPGGRPWNAVLLSAAALPLLGTSLTVVVAVLAPSPVAYVGVAASLVGVALLLAAVAVLLRASPHEQPIPS
ncbi:MAG TPA: hypothetical protein VFF67_00025 [Thermoplasmata archaeon]|nr:hypothetical protein [Thermoplasmata archaeon]